MLGSAVFRTGVAPGGALAGPWVRNSLWTAARAVPSLDLRFADNKSLVDAVTGAQLVTFTRASSGTFVGSDGLIKTAVTNLLTYSEQFDNAAWTKTNSTVTTNATTAPNGTLTAEKLITNSGASNGRASVSITVATDTPATFSCYAKQGETSVFGLFISDGVTGRAADFDLITGTVSGTPTAGMTASIQPVGNGWYRCVATVTSITGTTRSLRVVQTVAANDGTSGLFIWGAQFEQASTVGEYIPTVAAINSAPRFDHNPTTGESLGLLVEEARTNVVTWSQDFSQTDWTKAASTVVATAVASPIQGVNYQKIEATSANTTVGVTSIAVTAATQQRAVSFFAQPLGNISRVLAVIQGIDARININLVDGTFTTNAIATGSTVSVFGQRFSVSTPTLTLATGVRFFLKRTGETDTNTPTTIAIGEGLYLTGAQMEAGAFPTSYIPTTTATATRAADVASITGSNFSSWYNQTEGTVFADSVQANISPTSRLVSASDNTTSNRVALSRASGSSGNISLTVTNAGSAQVSSLVFGTALAAGTSNKVATIYKAADFAGSVNGLAAVTQGTGTVPSSLTQLAIGNGDILGANPMTGTIKRLTYWPTRLSTIQQISQP